MRKHGVVDAAADNAQSRRGLQGVGVFIAVERDDGQPFAYAADKQHGLLAADTVLARHPGQRGVDFGQAVRSAAAGGFVELDEQRQAGLMVDVIPVEHRHQHRRIEKTLHSPLPRFARSRSSRICCKHLIGGGGGQGLPGVKYPDAVLFGERTRPAHRAQGDLLAGAFHFQGVAGLQMQLFPQRLGDDDAARFINGETCVHSGTILWVEPSVNTILPCVDDLPCEYAGEAFQNRERGAGFVLPRFRRHDFGCLLCVLAYDASRGGLTREKSWLYLMKQTLDSAIAAFGAHAKEKLANPAATGQPEDQLRAPFEKLLVELAELCNLTKAAVAAVGESSVSDLKTRPDYAITVHNALVGFVELKAPGKGADPRKFKDPHDKAQWDKLHSLPNLIYTDGNAFSLWQNGELVGSVIKLIGDVESSGNKLQAPPGLLSLFESYLRWEPIPPRNAKDLAHTTARLCRLLRDEVTEQLALKSEALTALATDWRKLLFPDATDERFADGYAQAVTFGMLMARAKDITLATGLQQVASELSHTSSLIGAALRLLTDNAENQATLKTSLGTLTRVLDAVNWSKISKDRPDAWLYFYEDFLEVYDNDLRKQTGSYYTPPEVVGAMVALVDEALRTSRFGLHAGLASPSVTLADPATGTGTFLLGILRRIAETVRADEGEGSVKGAINSAVKRLIAFEMQLGPFAVAQLRVLAEIVDLTGAPPKTPARMFVTNTLGNPEDDEGWIPGILAPIAKSRKEANKIKREEPITVVIGNPPYKVKSKGLGGWIEGESKKAEKSAPLADWMPPPEWAAGVHSKHLRNLYIYFWRWATWKVYDHGPGNKTGLVCYITVAGFLSGLGFQKMRDYLRRTCDDIWVIDCSPEGTSAGSQHAHFSRCSTARLYRAGIAFRQV